MKLYLSSFRVGDRSAELAEMCSGRRIGLIPNAMDDVAAEPRAVSNDKAIKELVDLEIDVEVLDLRDYFGDRPRLEAILANLGGVWVRGGNTFVLRQAMKLSGFDGLLVERVGTDFFYGGYSAGICVLAPSLVGLGQVDDPTTPSLLWHTSSPEKPSCLIHIIPKPAWNVYFGYVRVAAEICYGGYLGS